MTRASKALFLLLLSMTLLAGCKSTSSEDSRNSNGAMAGSPTLPASVEKLSSATAAAREQTGYLGKSNDGATFIQWAKADRQIKGQMQIFDLKRTGETDSSSYSFEGISDGDNLSLTFRDRYLTFLEGRTITGTLKNDALTLVWPQRDGTLWTQTYRPASVADYNEAVRSLQEQASQIVAARQEAARQAQAARDEAARIAAEKRAVVDAHNTVTEAAESLRDAVRELPKADYYADALRRYDDAWRRMREAHAVMLEESKKPLTSSQLGIVESRLGGLGSRLGGIQSCRGAFETTIGSANPMIRDAVEEIERLRAAFAKLQQAVAANTTGEPRATITAEHISKAVEYARSEINKAVAAREAAQKQSAAYDKQGADLYRQAEAFVRTLKAVDR